MSRVDELADQRALFWARVQSVLAGVEDDLDPDLVYHCEHLLGRSTRRSAEKLSEVAVLMGRADVRAAEELYRASKQAVVVARAGRTAQTAAAECRLRDCQELEERATRELEQACENRRRAFDLVADLARGGLPLELLPKAVRHDDALEQELQIRGVDGRLITRWMRLRNL